MYVLLALSLLCSLERVVSETCLCTRHVESHVYPCPDRNSGFFANMYGNDYDEQCLPYAAAVRTMPGWKAVVGYNKVGYVEYDSNFYLKACTKTMGTAITYDHSCKPALKHGQTLSLKTTPTTSTSTTTTTTTTPRPTPPPTKKQLAPVPTQIYSKKCEFLKILSHTHAGAPSATHPNAKTCPDNTRTSSTALLFEACTGAHPDLTQWKQGLKVVDHCAKIPRGEPLGYFFGGQIAGGMTAIFWACKGTSFEVVFQHCQMKPAVHDVQSLPFFAKDNFYTVNW